MKLDLTHDMYLSRRPDRKSRPTPARDRADKPGIRPDPNGSVEQRQAWMRSRQLQPRDPLSFEKFLSIGEYAIACMCKRLEHQQELTSEEWKLFQVCAKAVEGYKKR
jgi:hypothetical protein